MSGESNIAALAGEPAGTERTPAARARLDWVDALKGLGIVAVVAGHVWTRGAVRDAIYAVHMPLFFILSGYTARPVPWRVLLPAGLRSLGVPFLCFSGLLLGADFLIEGMRGVRPIFPGWLHGASTILFATEKLRGPFTILWFIPCLFLARIVWNALAASGRRADARLVVSAVIGIGLLALVVQDLGMRSPFGLLAVPGAVLMIWAGALWRQWGSPRSGLLLLVMAAAVAALIWMPPVNMKLGDLGWPVLSLGGAVAATMTLARFVQSLPVALISVLAELGRASLVIMYAHVAFIHYLAPYESKAALFLIALVMSFAIDRLIRCSRLGRQWLLGERKTAG